MTDDSWFEEIKKQSFMHFSSPLHKAKICLNYQWNYAMPSRQRGLLRCDGGFLCNHEGIKQYISFRGGGDGEKSLTNKKST